jgi:hypothetical protein
VREEPRDALKRHMRMRSVCEIRVYLVVAVVIAFAAGCAVQPGSSPTGTVPAASSSGPVASPCPPAAGSTITVSETDTGRTVCARVSQRIEIYLHGTVASPWSAITVVGDPLRPTASGKLSLPLGVTGAVFTAVAPGQAEVDSVRPTCTSQPGGAACSAIAQFRVTVAVRD